MVRILLAAEGESDEIVAKHLLRKYISEAEIVPKNFPARGFPIVRRALPTLISAAHCQHYDMLVIHFDIDDSMKPGSHSVKESTRWSTLWDEVSRLKSEAKSKIVGRQEELQVAFMAPNQSTEAWLQWGISGGNGASWEAMNRRELKKELFGDPPRGMRNKTELHIGRLLAQLDTNSQWPPSLRTFIEQISEYHENE